MLPINQLLIRDYFIMKYFFLIIDFLRITEPIDLIQLLLHKCMKSSIILPNLETPNHRTPLLLLISQQLPNSRIEAILNWILRSPQQVLSYLGPRGWELQVPPKNRIIFLRGPASLLHIRIQIIEPSLSALLTTTPEDIFSAERPLTWTIILHPLQKSLVLLFLPWPYQY